MPKKSKNKTISLSRELENARQHYRRELKQHDSLVDQYYALGELLYFDNEYTLAQEAYELVLSLSPNHYQAITDLGLIAEKTDDQEQAITYYKQALHIEPNYTLALNNLAFIYHAQQKFKAAMRLYQKAVEINPEYPEALNNLGSVFDDLNQLDIAIDYYKRAISSRPDYDDAWLNLGMAYEDIDRPDDALDCFKKAMSVAPQNPNTHYRMALARIRRYEFKEGWKKYEWRWRADVGPEKRDFPYPYWDGKPLGNRTLLIWGEAGIGDEILFASLIPDLLRKNIKCILECEPRLVPLFTRSFSNIQVVPRLDPPHPATQDPHIKAQSAVASVLRWLRPDVSSFSHAQSYLIADDRLASELRKRYAIDEQPLIGISWRSKNNILERQKTTGLLKLAPILSQQGCRFVSLQYGDCRDEINQVKRKLNIDIVHDPQIDPLTDMDSFAAQVKAMDLVISVSNTTVHTAGALGVPCWVLLPEGGGTIWYWFLKREDTLWYKTVRLLRQTKVGEWDEVIQRVAQELQQYVTDFKPR